MKQRVKEFVQYDHFKMGTFQHTLTLIEHNCNMVSLDLKHAYFCVPCRCDNSEIFDVLLER